MKKLIAYILLVTLCLGLFAGCAEKPAETTPTENSDLSNARAYIFNMYKGKGSKDEAQVLTKDFEVVSAVPVGGVSYSITWTVEVTAGSAEDVAIVDGNNGAKKVDINEKPEEQLDFTLTATVSDAAGNKESVSFKYTVAAVEKPTGDEQVGTLAETIANGDKVIIYYPTETVAIANKAAGSKMDAAYAVVTDTTIKAVGAAVLVVTVDGNGNYTFTCGGKYLTAGATGNSLTLEDNASDYSLWTLEETENGWYIKNVNAAYNGNPQYLEFYSGFTTYGFNDTKKDIYTFQFYKTDAESVLPEKVEAPTDPKQIVDDAFALEEGSALPYDATLTGVITSIDTAWSDDYKNITVSITVTGSNGEKTISCFRLKAGDATTTDQAAALAVGDTITVSGIIKNYQGTVQFDAGCKLDAVTPGAGTDEDPTEDPTEPEEDPTEPEEDPTEPSEPDEEPTEPEPAGPSKISDVLNATSGTFTVKGVVTVVDGKNVYVQDSTGAICVRMSAEFDDIKLGDTIIGTGERADYNGLPQLGNSTYEKSSGGTLTAKEITISTLKKSDICTYILLKNVTVTEVYDNNGQYTMPNVTVQDSEGNTIQIYKCVAPEGLKEGDVITIKAAVSVYGEKYQLRNTLASEITIN